MNATKNTVASKFTSAGPQPLADEELGNAAGGCGHSHKKKGKRTTRRTSRWTRNTDYRDSRCSRYSRF